MNTLVQAVVLFNVATQIVKYFAKWMLHYDGSSPIFAKYQDMTLEYDLDYAKTAATAAITAHQFHTFFDPRHQNRLNPSRLYRSLMKIFADIEDSHKGEHEGKANLHTLEPAQVAKVVTDVLSQADLRNMDGMQKGVTLSEFEQLITSEQGADIFDLIAKYKPMAGDEQMLERIMNEESLEKLEEEIEEEAALSEPRVSRAGMKTADPFRESVEMADRSHSERVGGLIRKWNTRNDGDGNGAEWMRSVSGVKKHASNLANSDKRGYADPREDIFADVDVVSSVNRDSENVISIEMNHSTDLQLGSSTVNNVKNI